MRRIYREDLSHIHHTAFGDFARGAAPGVLALLRRAGIHDGLVVDLGCGSGLWARELLHAGYEVLGVDVSSAMLDLARSVAPGARFLRGTLHEVRLPRCRAVTALGEAVTYLEEGKPRPRLPELFARVSEALAPGGLFVFDVVLRSELRPMRYRAEREGEGWRVETEVEEDPRHALLTRRITTVREHNGAQKRAHEVHRVQTVSRAEVERALRECGFSVRVARRYGAFPLPPRRLAFRARLRG